jgi:putative nucleotidyltransferase with HDIG domain
MVIALYKSIKIRDSETAFHSLIMAECSYRLAEYFDPNHSILYYLGGLIHDVGKIGMKDQILKSTITIPANERTVLQDHVKVGAQLLNELELPETIIQMAEYHHERSNGTGYLYGLKGKDIPLAGRIAAIADTYSAMIQKRPYQDTRTHIEAVTIMNQNLELFDEQIIKIFFGNCIAETIYKSFENTQSTIGGHPRKQTGEAKLGEYFESYVGSV